MISHKYKCIFVHIPKCGGTSIEDVLWPGPRSVQDLWKGQIDDVNKYQTGGMQHLFARHIREEVGEEVFRSYFKFALVRNPWDKVMSQFVRTKYRRGDLRKKLGVRKSVDLAAYLNAIRKVTNVQWEAQHKFLEDENGDLIVDHIGRFEQIDKEFDFICETIGLPKVPLPHMKKSERSHYRDYYDAETRQAAAEIYSEDIEKFGYEY
jgi:chondroitin 4-sulfotransferase 11